MIDEPLPPPKGIVTREPWLQDAFKPELPVAEPIRVELDCPGPGMKRLTYASGAVAIIRYIPHGCQTR